MADRNDMLDIVIKCHDAAAGRSTWTEALEHIASFFGASAATLEVFHKPQFDVRFFQHHGMPDTVPEDYQSYFAQVNPRISHGLRAKAGEVVHDHQHIDERGMDGSEFYADFLRPMDLRYYFATNLTNSSLELSGLSVQRSRRQGHADTRDLSCLAALAPHVSQALDVHSRLQQANDRERALRDGIDWLADGMVLLDRNGTVVHANSAARSIFGQHDGLGCEGGRLVAGTSDDQTSLMRQVMQAVAGADSFVPIDAAPVVVSRPSGKPPYIVAIRPIARTGQGLRSAARTSVFIHDPCRNSVLDPAILEAHFGLTQAEASLAVALTNGIDLSEHAQLRGISINTARTQLAKVMQKLDVRRQAELVRLLISLVQPVN